MSLSLPVTTERDLTLLPRLAAELAVASSIEEATIVAKKTAVLTAMAKQIGKKGRAINQIARLRIDAIGRAGEMIAATVKPRGSGNTRLPEGIDKMQSSRWQAVARITVAERERFFAVCDETDEEITVAGLLRTARHLQKKQKIASQIEALSKEAIELPCGPFRVIVADPPWHYELRAQDPSHRGSLPYPSMDLDSIKALGISDIAAEDSVLWLWTTNAHLREAFEVVDAWGFTYKTMLTWVKSRMGLGCWLRGQTEHCLFAVRGKPTINLTNQTTVLRGDVRSHSEKPDEFYTLVESLCAGSKIDVFARQPRDGWAGYGDELRTDSASEPQA